MHKNNGLRTVLVRITPANAAQRACLVRAEFAEGGEGGCCHAKAAKLRQE